MCLILGYECLYNSRAVYFRIRESSLVHFEYNLWIKATNWLKLVDRPVLLKTIRNDSDNGIKLTLSQLKLRVYLRKPVS